MKAKLLGMLMLLGCTQAGASLLWDWSYAGSNGTDVAFGTLTTSDLVGVGNGSFYTITGITGRFDGVAITGLGTGLGPSSQAPDFSLFASGARLDTQGLAFQLSNQQTDFILNLGNQYFLVPQGQSATALNMGNFAAYEVGPVPEPSSLALFAIGLAGLALLRRLRPQPARAA